MPIYIVKTLIRTKININLNDNKTKQQNLEKVSSVYTKLNQQFYSNDAHAQVNQNKNSIKGFVSCQL